MIILTTGFVLFIAFLGWELDKWNTRKMDKFHEDWKRENEDEIYFYHDKEKK